MPLYDLSDRLRVSDLEGLRWTGNDRAVGLTGLTGGAAVPIPDFAAAGWAPGPTGVLLVRTRWPCSPSPRPHTLTKP